LAELTLDQQKAIAMASARARMASAPDTTAQPSLGDQIRNYAGGLEQSLYDLPQSAMELGARGTDALGLTDNAYRTLHNEFQNARQFEGNPQDRMFRGGEVIGNIATTAPMAGVQLPAKAAAMAPRLAPIINGALQGGQAAALTSAGSDAPLGQQIGTGMAAGALLPSAGLLLQGAKNIGANVLGATTGAGANSIRNAYAAGAAGGDAAKAFTTALTDPSSWGQVVSDAKAAIGNLRASRQAAYRSGMADISKDASVLDFTPVDDALASRTNTYAGRSGTGPVQALSPKTADVRQEVAAAVDNWKSLDPADFHTPEGFDALKQQIGDIRDGYQYGSPQWKYANDVYGSVRNTIADQAPTYDKVMGDYSKASDTITELEKELSAGRKGNPNTALRKLQSVMRDNVNTSWGKRAELANTLVDNGATNLLPSLAGQALSSPLPRGLARWGDATVGGLAALASHGAAALPMLAAASPRLVGNAAYGAGVASRGATNLANAIPLSLPQSAINSGLGTFAPRLLLQGAQ
jgi:hypothetical protein